MSTKPRPNYALIANRLDIYICRCITTQEYATMLINECGIRTLTKCYKLVAMNYHYDTQQYHIYLDDSIAIINDGIVGLDAPIFTIRSQRNAIIPVCL